MTAMERITLIHTKLQDLLTELDSVKTPAMPSMEGLNFPAVAGLVGLQVDLLLQEIHDIGLDAVGG